MWYYGLWSKSTLLEECTVETFLQNVESFTRLLGITFQKVVILVVIAVRPSYLASIYQVAQCHILGSFSHEECQ